MFGDVRNGLAKLKKDFQNVSDKMNYWADGAPVVHFGHMEVELTGTLFFINAGALLDEGLLEYINNQFPNPTYSQTKDLNAKINFLNTEGRISNALDLHVLRKKRNEFAHEAAKYGNWEDARWAITVLESTFRDLGML